MSMGTTTMSSDYWEERATRFATRGRGLAAVCAYGMPAFYNAAIDICQRLALRDHLQVTPGQRVLDVGCGVGRWSVAMAAQGASVTGIDLSDTMVREAQRRAAAAGHETRCRFLRQNVADLGTGRSYSLILVVTVLQHVTDPERLERAVARLAAHLESNGRLVVLEAAPARPNARCDTGIFTARTEPEYRALFARHGLQPVSVSGVDPMPLRTMFLPHYRRLPRPVALTGLAAATALSLPVDLVAGRAWVSRSWHKVFVLRHIGRGGDA